MKREQRRRRQRGQTLVEFALILPVLLLILIGIFEFGRIIFLYANLFNAAREGARYGLTHPQDYNGILQHAQERITLTELSSGDLTVSMDTGPTSSDICVMDVSNDCASYAVIGNRVKVSIGYIVSPLTPLFEPIINELNLQTEAARTIQRVSATVSTPPPTAPPTDPGEEESLPVISIIKTASPNPAEPGDTISYDITVTNDGAGDATGVFVSDTLDTNTTLVAGSASASAGTVTTSGNSVEIDIGDLASGASVSISYQATVNDPLPAGVTSITNQAVVSSNEDDTRSAEATVSVDAGPVLQITKSSSEAYASPGDEMTYSIRIANVGNQEDTNVEFSDTLPAYLSLVAGSVSTTQGSVTTGNGTGDTSVLVDVGTLDSGTAVDITFRATIAGSDMFETGETAITNEGFLTSDTYADGLSDTATFYVTVGPYLDARKSGGLYQDVDRDGTIGPGDVLYYKIVLTNVGNQDATNVIVTDNLDANTTMVAGSAEATQGRVASNDTSLTAYVGTLPVDATVTLNFRVTVDEITYAVNEVSNQAVGTCDELPQVTFETNRVTTPVTSDPIIIAKPVVAGIDFVEGTALANQELTLEVLRTNMPAITTQSDASGYFRFENLSNAGITLEAGAYVLVKGYGTQDIARVEVAPEGSYITVNAICIDPLGDTLTIDGYNWSTTKNEIETIVIALLDGTTVEQSTTAAYDDSGSFTIDLAVPGGLTGGPYTLQATGYYKYGKQQETVIDTATTPIELCPETPELPPDIEVESMELVLPYSTAMVVLPPGTYEPLTVTIVLTNTTTTDVTSLFEVDLFVDPDPDAYLFEQESVDHIGVQVLEGSSRISFEMYVPDGLSDMEPHTLTVKADTFEQILENDETNNVSSLTAQANYTNTPPVSTDPITPTLDPGAIQGETWLILQDELMPQNGVEVYAETTVTDTDNLTTTVRYGPVFSDNLGRYTLTDLPPATYTVTGEYELLEDLDGDGSLERVLYSNSVEVQVTSGVTVTDVYLILEPVGTP